MKRILTVLLIIALAMTYTACGQARDKSSDLSSSPGGFLVKSSAVPDADKQALNSGLTPANNTNSASALNYTDVRAIWLSYIDLAPMLTGKTQDQFTGCFEAACKNISELGCNTVYVHVRPFGDALYDSELYPCSKYISGFAGRKGTFDPLEIMVNTAHKYKLSFHGWINPLRLESEDSFACFDTHYAVKKWFDSSNGYVRRVSGDKHLWLDPGYSEVRKLIADGAAEIVRKYAVDGIHYDDYFYPTTEEDFDKACYTASKTDRPLSQWRLDNISKMVREIYCAVKSVRNDIQVGVSPQGNIQNNYQYMYADVKKWGSEQGYVDYMCPQIYFGYDNPVKPFLNTLNEWKSIVTCDKVILTVGLAVYKISGKEQEFVSNCGIIAKQISDIYALKCCKGFSLYAYNNIFAENERARKELYSIKAYLSKK